MIRTVFKRTLVPVVLLAFIQVASAQTFRSDMEKVEENLVEQDIRFSMRYTMYPSDNSNSIIQQMNATYYLAGEMYVYETDQVYLLANRKMSLSVDHDQRVVIINKYDPSSKRRQLKELTSLLTDSVRKQVAKDTLLLNEPGRRVWRVTFARPVKGIDHIDVTVDPVEARIQKMVYYYAYTFKELYDEAPDGVPLSGKPRLEVLFADYTLITPAEKNRLFTGEQFVKIDKSGKATLMPKYNTYKLSNFYNLKK